MTAVVLALVLAPAQCWGPTLRLPVRQAPLVTPLSLPTGQGKACPCSALCACGCQEGMECVRCQWPGKPARPLIEKKPEKAPEAKAPKKIEQVDNFGVDADKLGQRARYTLSDQKGRRSVDRFTALESIEKGLPDESSLLRLTVIGTEAQRKRVLADLDSAALAEWKGKLIVQAREPTDLYLASRGFVTTGQPTLYVQAPDGRVLGRNLDGQHRGPEALAQGLAQAKRRYDPARDPDLWPAQPAPGPASSFWGPALLGGAVLLLLVLFARRPAQS